MVYQLLDTGKEGDRVGVENKTSPYGASVSEENREKTMGKGTRMK